MSTIKPAQPDCAAGKYIDVSASSQQIQLSTSPAMSSWIIVNDGTATVFINTGATNAVTAAMPSAGASNFPVPAGSIQVVTFATPAGSSALYVAAIAAAATGKIYFIPVLNRSENGI